MLFGENMSTSAKKPINYLNNKDIMKEIHKSKNSYCSFSDPNYHQYDFIIDYEDNSSLEKNLAYTCQDEIINLAKESKANRDKIDIESINKTDLIFRVMTWDHIPLAPKPTKQTQKPKSARELFEFNESSDVDFSDLEDPELTTSMNTENLIHIRVNFPPFQHFKFDQYDNLICIGKSHWSGDLDSGEFSKDHGQITDKLARMYLMLCEKYALRFNWRDYTYREEMQNSAILQLTYVGLRFNEAKSQNPFAYYSEAIKNSFRRVLNTEKKNQNIRDDILEMSGLSPSWTRQFNSSDSSNSDSDNY